MRVLVTGARGYVGRHLLDTLPRAGFDVVAAVRSAGAPLPVPTVAGDLSDPVAARRCMVGVDAVVHAAARVSGDDPAAFWRDNVDATRALLSAAEGRPFVHLSTVMVYGLGVQEQTTEDAPLAPGGVLYAETKLAAERAVARAGGPWVALRPGVVWGGPYDQRFMPRLRLLARSPLIPIPGPGITPMPWSHVDNLVELVALALRGPLPNAPLNATDGTDLGFREFLERYLAAHGYRGRVLPLPVRGAAQVLDRLPRLTRGLSGDVLRLFETPCTFSSERARTLYDWAPRLREHLALTAG